MSAAQLGEHATLIRGITFKPADKCDPDDEGAVVCMRTKNVQATLDESDLIAIPRSLVKNPEKMISTGDILVSSANSWNLVGKCCQVRQLRYPSAAGGFISILRPKTDQLDPSYLYRWFASEDTQRRLRSFGNQTTNISNLNHKRTLNLDIPLPPLAEQKRIAGILDAADALRAKCRESLAQLDTLLQSIFLDMFGDPVTNPMGWDVVLLGEVTTRVTKGESPKWQGFDYQDDGALFVTSENVREGFIDVSKPKFIPLEFNKKLNRSELRKGDLLINLVGASIGRSCLFPGFDRPANVNQAVGVATLDDSVEPMYFATLFSTARGQEMLLGNRVEAARANISLKNIRELRVPLPPLDLQHRFASIVESIEKQKASQRTHLAELDTLFASLQSRAFRGNL